jgi:cation diffusion facilitator CzcD-associated flavoprotein CzcO
MTSAATSSSGRNGVGDGAFPIAIVGAGFAGIGAAIRLLQAGIDSFTIFERANVELVTEPIARIVPSGIETRDGARRELDAIVLATGFALGLASAPFRVIGRGGRSLGEAWSGGAVAYKGMSVSGFPNWFILMGPNTGPGHTSVLLYTEAQIEHVLGAIRRLRGKGLRSVEVRQEAQERWNAGIQGRMEHMVWSSGCKSWYLSEDGSNHSLYPGFATEYVLRTRRFDPRDYLLVGGDVGLEV